MNTFPCGSCRNIVISHTQVEGSRRHRDHQTCEDVVWIQSAGDHLFCGLADGQSGAKHGAEGGRVCLEAISEFVDSVGIGNLLNTPFPDELPCAFVKAFRKKLLSLVEKNTADINDFASTLLAVAVDLRNGNYILLHLGDGCAIGIPHTGDPVPISTPDNGITSQHTWLTTSDNAVSHFRITFGSFSSKKRLLLTSDGATSLCRGREIPRRAKDLLKAGCHTQIYERLIQSKPIDDATCIILDVCESTRP